MDENLVLLLLTSLSCIAIGLRVLALRGRQGLPWAAACALVLATAGACYAIWPQLAGYVAAGLGALFVFIPMYAGSGVGRLTARRRFAAARRLARVARTLHPSREFRELPGYIDAVERLQRGEIDTRVLSAEPPSTPLGRFVYLQTLRMTGRLAELVTFIEAQPDEVRRSDAALALYEVRALAELGRIEAMLRAHARIETAPALAGVRDLSRVAVAARLGRGDLLERVLSGAAARALPEGGAAYFRAVTLQVLGDPRAETIFEELASRDGDIARAARQRLAAPFGPVAVSELSEAAQATLRQLEGELESARGLSGTSARTPATAWLLASLGAVFALEVPGGTTDVANLVELGALVIPAFSGADQPYRLVTAAFLHLGSMHLVMNGLGVWILGRPVEAIYGKARMLALFLVSAVSGNLAALWLLEGPAILVGASGGVLGLLGSLLAVTLVRFRKQPTRFLRGHARGWLVVIAMQAVFDLMVPGVSSIAHVFGFAAGLGLGLLLAANR